MWKSIGITISNPIGAILGRFFSKNQIIESRLFEVDSENRVCSIPKFLPKCEREIRLLKRNSLMEANIITEANKVIDSYKNRMNQSDSYVNYEGLIYFVYTKSGENFEPIYIGITHKIGRNGNLNQNLNVKNRDFFVRWGDDIARHIGGLSNVLFKNGYEEEQKYFRFSSAIFEKVDNLIIEKKPL